MQTANTILIITTLAGLSWLGSQENTAFMMPWMSEPHLIYQINCIKTQTIKYHL